MALQVVRSWLCAKAVGQNYADTLARLPSPMSIACSNDIKLRPKRFTSTMHSFGIANAILAFSCAVSFVGFSKHGETYRRTTPRLAVFGPGLGWGLCRPKNDTSKEIAPATRRRIASGAMAMHQLTIGTKFSVPGRKGADQRRTLYYRWDTKGLCMPNVSHVYCITSVLHVYYTHSNLHILQVCYKSPLRGCQLVGG